MSRVRRVLFFFIAVCCWGPALAFTLLWLCAHIEHAEAAKTVRIPMARAEKKGRTVFSAQFEMDARKWRCHDHRVRILVSMPAGTEVRKMLEERSLAVRVNAEEAELTMGNVHEPYAEMRRHALHPGNCVLAEAELDCGKGRNVVSLEIAPDLFPASGVGAVLYFPDSAQRTAALAVKAGGTIFFLLLAAVLSLLFFHCERSHPGRLRTLLARAFLMIPVEFFLMLLSVALWKAALAGCAPLFLNRLVSGICGVYPVRETAQLFFLLNLILFAILLVCALLLTAWRLIRLFRTVRGKR